MAIKIKRDNKYCKKSIYNKNFKPLLQPVLCQAATQPFNRGLEAKHARGNI